LAAYGRSQRLVHHAFDYLFNVTALLMAVMSDGLAGVHLTPEFFGLSRALGAFLLVAA
jgi:hypothetical protein